MAEMRVDARRWRSIRCELSVFVRRVLPWTAGSAKIHSVPIHDQTRAGNDVMRLRGLRIIQRALGAGGMAALLLAIGALGAAAPGQDGAKPAQAKDQPRAGQGQGRRAEAGRVETRPGQARAVDQRSEGIARVHPDFPIRFIENVSFRHAGQSRAFVGDGLWSGTVRFPPR